MSAVRTFNRILNSVNRTLTVSHSPGKTICYLDCFSGVSGDMLLGALIHAGLDRELLLSELEKLQLDGLQLKLETRMHNGISAVKVEVDSSRKQQLRTLPAIVDLLEKSRIDDDIVEKALLVFQALARAEAKVHNIDMDRVHFHEVGALDTIVDIVGTVVGLRSFGVSKLLCSPLPAGRGFISCAHGLLPNPAPATCELLTNVPVYGVDLEKELVTPTGAAIVATLADGFCQMPPLSISCVGYGAGSHKLDNGQPNLLRLIIGKELDVAEEQRVEVIETNLDDFSPEGFPYLFERLFSGGALDVSITPIQMKKGRPGFTLQVISGPARAFELKRIILEETSAIGLRFRTEQRQTLKRSIVEVPTQWGEIKAKKVDTPLGAVIHPEYEECRRIAVNHQVPLREVYNAVRKAGV